MSTICELNKIKKHFTQKNGNPKIKQDTLCKENENVGLKNVGITFKIISYNVLGFNDFMTVAHMNGSQYL